MPVLLEGRANFSKEEERFISFITSDTFPWYFCKATPNFFCLTHAFLKRTDTDDDGLTWSQYSDAAKSVFYRICADNNIVVRKIYRMAANLTFADPSLHGDPHNDHEGIQHKVMIVYLNKFDAGETWLFDEQFNFECKIAAEADKFVVFDGGNHANGFCKPQQARIVFVATFDGDVLKQG